MKVIINNTKHAVYASGKLLIPGTNVVEDKEFDDEKSDVKSLIANGDIEVYSSDKMDDKAKKKAVSEITSPDALKKLSETFPKLDVSSAKERLEEFDKQVKG